MKVIRGLENYNFKKKSVVTIGTFDGVHLGHQKILLQLVKEAHKNNFYSVVLTFHPHPRKVVEKKNEIQFIDTLEERIKFLEKIGIDILVVHPFLKSFSLLKAKDFVEKILINRLKTSKVIIGYNHRFGHNREAGIDELKALGKENFFEVEKVEKKDISNVSISSTKIRKALKDGDMPVVSTYLGRHFLMTGKVIGGKKIGRTIGFPTANFKIVDKEKIIPKNGVYCVCFFWEKKKYKGMMNIGYRPTLQGDKKSVEVHFFNFNANLYNETIQVEVLKKIRDEIAFSNLQKLKIQLEKDKEICL